MDLLKWASKMLGAILSLLPTSPFRGAISTFSSWSGDYMGYIAYFVPVKIIIDLTIAWTVCIAMYYLYSIILRWIKAIE